MEGWWAASYLVLWLLVIVLAVLLVALARQVGTLHMRLGPRGALEIDDEGPPLGEAPIPIDALDVTGEPVSFGGPGEAQLLLFVSATCRVCDEVLPATAVVAVAGDFVPYVITDAPLDEARSLRSKSARARVVSSVEATKRYEIPGTPYAVILDDLGIVRAKGTANNLEQLEGLVDTALRRTAQRRAS